MEPLVIEILSPTRAKISAGNRVLYTGARHVQVECLTDILREYDIPVEVRDEITQDGIDDATAALAILSGPHNII